MHYIQVLHQFWHRQLDATLARGAVRPHAMRFFALMMVAALLAALSPAVVAAQVDPPGPVPATDAAESIYMPAAMKNKCTTNRALTLYGVQMYGATGFGYPYYSDLIASQASWIRNVVNWATVEPTNTTPDKYAWGSADAAVAVAQQDCINVILTLEHNPAWASDFPEGRINKVGLDELAQFMAALVERYDGDGVDDAPGSPKVHHFEIYNEPDAGPSGNSERWGFHGDAYAAMLKAIYPAMKNANPQAQVVFGGLAFDFFYNPQDPANSGPFVRNFFEDVLKNGGGPYFDLMNYHFYPLFGPNWTDNFPKDGPGLVEKTEALRAIMRKYAVDKPVIITEMGWHNNIIYPYGSDTVQVRMVQQLYAQSIVAGVPLAAWWPIGDPGGAYLFNSGLVTNHEKGTPERKAAFYAYLVLTRELGNMSFVRAFSFGDDIKAYELRDNTRGRTIFIAWTNPTNPNTVWGLPNNPGAYVDTTRTATITLNASRVTVYDAFWQVVKVVNDGDDGRNDGKVKVTINGDPKYIVPG